MYVTLKLDLKELHAYVTFRFDQRKTYMLGMLSDPFSFLQWTMRPDDSTMDSFGVIRISRDQPPNATTSGRITPGRAPRPNRRSRRYENLILSRSERST